MNKALEPLFVHGVKRLLFGIWLGRTNAEGELLVAAAHPFPLALLERKMPQIQSNVDHTKNAGVNAQQVHLVEHDTSPKPARSQILIVPAGRQFSREVGLNQHGL